MSTRDFFKNSVLEAFGQVDPAKIGLSLLVALAMGILIYCVYKRFFTGVVYSRSFAVTLVGMCVLTCMVTLAISTNVVISLGMVGALSIVRYRTAVKANVHMPPAGHYGDVEKEIGRVVVQLCGPDFKYMNGETVTLEGGMGQRP